MDNLTRNIRANILVFGGGHSNTTLAMEREENCLRDMANEKGIKSYFNYLKPK